MKKFLSILLVVMLVLSMIPATVSAETTEITFNLGANGSASHNDGTSKTSYSETVDGYTLSITSGTKMYTGARDAKGNSCIKLGTGNAAASFSMTVPDDVTAVVFYIAKYKTNTAKVSINGTTHTLSKESNSGEYDEIEVDTSNTNTISLKTLSGGYRAMINTIVFRVGEQEEVECDHVGYEPVVNNDYNAPTCTNPGNTASTKCPNCGETIDEQKPIDALGHEYEDEACIRCGMVDPACPKADLLTEEPGAGDVIAIYNPAGKVAIGTEADQDDLDGVLTEAEDGKLPYNAAVAQLTVGVDGVYYTFANSEGAYLSSDSDGGSLNFQEEATEYSKWSLESAGANVWYITNAAAASPALEAYNGFFTTYSEGTSDLYKMALYLVSEASCDHANKTEQDDGYDATCTEDGLSNSWKCDDCGATVVPQEVIGAPGHDWVDGVCQVCGAEEPNEVVFELGEDGSAGHSDNNTAKTTYTETVDGYTLNLTAQGSMYPGSKDEKGNGAIKLGTSSKTGGFSFTVPGNVVEVMLYVAKYKANTSKITVNGVAYTLSGSSNDGEYDVIAVDTSIEKTVELTTVSGGVRAMVNTIVFCYEPINFVTPEEGVTFATLGDAIAAGYPVKSVKGEALPPQFILNQETENPQRFVTLGADENGFYTYYLLDLRPSAVSLRLNKAGIYYTAEIVSTDLLAALAGREDVSYGIALSLDGVPMTKIPGQYTVNDGVPTAGEFLSGSVFNIFKGEDAAENKSRGEMVIYASAYITIGDETFWTPASTNWSLRGVVEAIDANLATLVTKPAQQQRVVDFYNTWAEAMNLNEGTSAWNIPNIKTLAAQDE